MSFTDWDTPLTPDARRGNGPRIYFKNGWWRVSLSPTPNRGKALQEHWVQAHNYIRLWNDACELRGGTILRTRRARLLAPWCAVGVAT